MTSVLGLISFGFVIWKCILNIFRLGEAPSHVTAMTLMLSNSLTLMAFHNNRNSCNDVAPFVAKLANLPSRVDSHSARELIQSKTVEILLDRATNEPDDELQEWVQKRLKTYNIKSEVEASSND